MQDEQPTSMPQAGDDQSCGCTCEFCMAGNHDQCQTGMCKLKKQDEAPEPPADGPVA